MAGWLDGWMVRWLKGWIVKWIEEIHRKYKGNYSFIPLFLFY